MKVVVFKTWVTVVLGIAFALVDFSSAAIGLELPSEAKGPARRHALIVIGLPGDDEHRQSFLQTAKIWRQWLVQVAGVESKNVTVLCSDDRTDDTPPATSEEITKVVKQLETKLTSEDSLWVFLLGHGSHDKRHGWFHLPGPDLNSAQWAGLFAQLQAREQVFWLTHAASGSFLKPISLPGRIVITATDADGEINETRFPHVLAEIMQRQLDENDEDAAIDPTPSSVRDLFLAATRQVKQTFDGEQLVPTEHAQLDDNGDGAGTELTQLATESDGQSDNQADPTRSLIDGVLAGRLSIKLPSLTDSKADLPSSAAQPKP